MKPEPASSRGGTVAARKKKKKTDQAPPSAMARPTTKATYLRAGASVRGLDQTLKELPQPQDEVALGFFTWKDDPTISST